MSPLEKGLPSAIDSCRPTEPPVERLARDPFVPLPALVRAIEPETPGVATFWLELQDKGIRDAYSLRPGQFNMIYVPGVGEVPISVSSLRANGTLIGHTIRCVGRVTRYLDSLKVGTVLGVRGPYGTGWPMEQVAGRDVVLVAGGLGLAPLKLAVERLLAQRERFGRLILLYGAREPRDLLYQATYDDWERQGFELLVTVDRAGPGWSGRVGVVPLLLRRVRLEPSRTVLMSCGPEIMMRYTAAEALAERIDPGAVYLSHERNMQCAVGLCGRCQFGSEFICKDGPVLSYARVAPFMNHEHF